MAELESMTIKELVNPSFSTMNEEDLLSSALGKFEQGVETIFVLDALGNLKGALTESHVIKSKANPSKTKVKSILFHCPRVFENESLLKAARQMIEGDVKQLPVFNELNKMAGVISIEALLNQAAKAALGRTRIIELCSKNPLTSTEATTIGEALHTMREQNISHLPVLDRKGVGVGMLTMHDLSTKYYSPRTKGGKGEIISEKTHELKLPASNLMNYPLESIFEKEECRKAVEKMLGKNISSLAVLDERGRLSGIVTKTDILQHLMQQEKPAEMLTFSFAKGHELESIDEIELEHIKSDFERYGKKYSHFLHQSQAVVYIKKHKEKTRRLSLYHVRVRIFSPEGVIAAHANGFGLPIAVHNALKKLVKLTEKERSKKIVKKEKSRARKQWF